MDGPDQSRFDGTSSITHTRIKIKGPEPKRTSLRHRPPITPITNPIKQSITITTLSSLVRPSSSSSSSPDPPEPTRPYSDIDASANANANAVPRRGAPAPPFEGQSAVHQPQGKGREKAG
jgi:hypothetical protein